MTKQLKATFDVSSWDENPIEEQGTDGQGGLAKLTRALVEKKYAGDIEGTSSTTWLMAYAPDESATFVGIERIVGAVGGRKGSLVLQHVGTFRDGAAKAKLTVVSGTDELDGASGSGDFLADPAGSVSLALD